MNKDLFDPGGPTPESAALSRAAAALAQARAELDAARARRSPDVAAYETKHWAAVLAYDKAFAAYVGG